MQRVLFLDRDGVINEKARRGEYIISWEAFRFREGIADLLITSSAAGYRNIVVTNQQCIGKGLVTQQEVDELHRRMVDELARSGARIDAVYCCPHLESVACECRKPRAGLLVQAAKDIPEGVDKAHSYLVGDSEIDIAAGRAFGVATLLLRESFEIDLVSQATCADYVVGALHYVGVIIRG